VPNVTSLKTVVRAEYSPRAKPDLGHLPLVTSKSSSPWLSRSLSNQFRPLPSPVRVTNAEASWAPLQRAKKKSPPLGFPPPQKKKKKKIKKKKKKNPRPPPEARTAPTACHLGAYQGQKVYGQRWLRRGPSTRTFRVNRAPSARRQHRIWGIKSAFEKPRCLVSRSAVAPSRSRRPRSAKTGPQGRISVSSFHAIEGCQPSHRHQDRARATKTYWGGKT